MKEVTYNSITVAAGEEMPENMRGTVRTIADFVYDGFQRLVSRATSPWPRWQDERRMQRVSAFSDSFSRMRA